MSTTSPDAVGEVTGDCRPGLREAKKARTRRALIETGLRLFHEQGYGNTTTEEIAARAGVSQRTFFRYFPTKEDVVLEAMESVDDVLVEHLLARPAEEAPFEALRNAMRDHWETLSRTAMHHFKGGAAEIIAESPELVRTGMTYCRRRQSRLAEAIALRTGAAPGDLRPELVSAVFFAALSNGHEEWERTGAAGLSGLLDCFMRQLELVPEAIGSGWGTPAAG
ncbi:TetR family transcriptional regulator [Nocardiopsis changdeensis]|uniref:TetR family transcriptional regulator n=1 Tax=Nocardiopsis changdeensis TaxID=2831969 RepID=A0ABX8BMI5_9ACTN|nr:MULTISPECIES: TetR family transcriptional regulator [Nocardiopsis]QUX23450.1 TetR family transcriptional regulator [Nocardiopsis changdeensis]QYX39394.1 TetR family transcriptional regulator [Nocardiopsis sp. MT53]